MTHSQTHPSLQLLALSSYEVRLERKLENAIPTEAAGDITRWGGRLKKYFYPLLLQEVYFIATGEEVYCCSYLTIDAGCVF